MSEEEVKVWGAVFMMIFVLVTLPVITIVFESVNTTSGSTIAPVKMGFPEIRIEDPFQKGIARNIGTGIIVILLILVSAGVVFALRFLYQVIRGNV